MSFVDSFMEHRFGKLASTFVEFRRCDSRRRSNSVTACMHLSPFVPENSISERSDADATLPDCQGQDTDNECKLFADASLAKQSDDATDELCNEDTFQRFHSDHTAKRGLVLVAFQPIPMLPTADVSDTEPQWEMQHGRFLQQRMQQRQRQRQPQPDTAQVRSQGSKQQHQSMHAYKEMLELQQWRMSDHTDSMPCRGPVTSAAKPGTVQIQEPGNIPMKFSGMPRRDPGAPSALADTAEVTTLMISSLPYDLCQKVLLQKLDQYGFRGLYNFVYMPHEFRTGHNLNMAFVNFVSAAAAGSLLGAWHGQNVFGTGPSCVKAADVQGLDANKAKFCTRLQRIRNPRFRPFVKCVM